MLVKNIFTMYLEPSFLTTLNELLVLPAFAVSNRFPTTVVLAIPQTINKARIISAVAIRSIGLKSVSFQENSPIVALIITDSSTMYIPVNGIIKSQSKTEFSTGCFL